MPLFFAISGFILALPFVEQFHGASGQRVFWGRYFLRRLTRLEPPYLINLAVAALILIMKGQTIGGILPHALASATYLHNQIYGEWSTLNGVAWSLEVEVQFYLLMPVFAWLILRQGKAVRRSVILGLILSGIAWKFANPQLANRYEYSLLRTFQHFLAGILLADWYVTDMKSAPEPRGIWDLWGTVAWLAIPLTQQFEFGRPLLPLLTLIAYVGSFRGPRLRSLLSTPIVTTIGGMCYTLYLYHFFIIAALERVTLPLTARRGYLTTLVVQSLLIFPPTLIVGALLFRLFERPFMSWRPGKKQPRTE